MATTDRYLVKMYGKKFQLKKLHDLWQRKSDTNVIAEDGLCVIRTILGETQLLMNKKCGYMERFIKRVEKGKELNVSDDDFRVLWDMISIEINDLIAKYQELELLEANNWNGSTSVSISPKSAEKSTPLKVQKHPEKTKSVVHTITNSTPPNPRNFTSTIPAPTGNSSNHPKNSLVKPVRSKLPSPRPVPSTSNPAPTANSSSRTKTCSITPVRSKLPSPRPVPSRTNPAPTGNSSNHPKNCLVKPVRSKLPSPRPVPSTTNSAPTGNSSSRAENCSIKAVRSKLPSPRPVPSTTNPAPTGNSSSRTKNCSITPVRSKLPSPRPVLSTSNPAPAGNLSSRAENSLTKPVRRKITSVRSGTSSTKPRPTENSSSCVASTRPKSITTEKNMDTPSRRHNISSIKAMIIKTCRRPASACVISHIIRPILTRPASAHVGSGPTRRTPNRSYLVSVLCSTVLKSTSSTNVIPLKPVPNNIRININDEEASNSDSDEYFDALSSLDDL